MQTEDYIWFEVEIHLRALNT